MKKKGVSKFLVLPLLLALAGGGCFIWKELQSGGLPAGFAGTSSLPIRLAFALLGPILLLIVLSDELLEFFQRTSLASPTAGRGAEAKLFAE